MRGCFQGRCGVVSRTRELVRYRQASQGGAGRCNGLTPGLAIMQLLTVVQLRWSELLSASQSASQSVGWSVSPSCGGGAALAARR
jgi:hypothetical protein